MANTKPSKINYIYYLELCSLFFKSVAEHYVKTTLNAKENHEKSTASIKLSLKPGVCLSPVIIEVDEKDM